MKNMNYFLVALTLMFSFAANAFDTKTNFKGFVNIGAKQLFVNYNAPQKSQPTLILLNGLTYSTRQWDAMTAELLKYGFGVLRYDMDGMGETLLKYLPKSDPYYYADQITDLDLLLKTLSIQAPYNIVGLSYGGGIAAGYSFKYPTQVNKVVLMAPYTQPLKGQDDWIKQQISVTRMQFPFNPYSDEQLYDYFLRQICFTSYPSLEPIVLENPYKLEGVFRLTQGIRKFDVLAEVNKFPKNSVYLIIAKQDQYIPASVLENFWDAIPASAKVEKIYVEDSEHKIPEARPVKAAEILNHIFN
jgi:pimeloyl-ACP methyl ester carboxylesterase